MEISSAIAKFSAQSAIGLHRDFATFSKSQADLHDLGKKT